MRGMRERHLHPSLSADVCSFLAVPGRRGTSGYAWRQIACGRTPGVQPHTGIRVRPDETSFGRYTSTWMRQIACERPGIRTGQTKSLPNSAIVYVLRRKPQARWRCAPTRSADAGMRTAPQRTPRYPRMNSAHRGIRGVDTGVHGRICRTPQVCVCARKLLRNLAETSFGPSAAPGYGSSHG
jgi:hypothetical protein